MVAQLEHVAAEVIAADERAVFERPGGGVAVKRKAVSPYSRRSTRLESFRSSPQSETGPTNSNTAPAERELGPELRYRDIEPLVRRRVLKAREGAGGVELRVGRKERAHFEGLNDVVQAAAVVLVRVGADHVVELRDAEGAEVVDHRLALGADAGVYEQRIVPAGDKGAVALAHVYVRDKDARVGQGGREVDPAPHRCRPS